MAPSTDQGIVFNAEIGGVLKVQLDEKAPRMPSKLVGMVPDQYVIITGPVDNHGAGVLKEGATVTISTSNMGKRFTFESTVLRALEKPYKLCILSYPEEIGRLDLRKQKRIECFIPVILSCHEAEADGVIVDISTGGVKVTIDDPPADPADFCAKLGDHLVIELPSIEMKDALRFQCEVRSTASDIDELTLGLQFVDMEDMEKIERYVEEMTVAGGG